MTRHELVATLAAIEHRLATRVELWRTVLDEEHQPTSQRIYRGSFQAPDYTVVREQLSAHAKGKKT